MKYNLLNAEKIENLIERCLFQFRPFWLLLFSLTTVYLTYHAIQLRPDASFSRMVPQNHPYIAAANKYKTTLQGKQNILRVAIEISEGDIFTKEYVEILRKINDEIFFLGEVDRAGMQSLWTPNVRWSEVTEEGFEGDTVIPKSYDGSDESIDVLRKNVYKSGQIGNLVSNNLKSTVILVPLLEQDTATGEPINYQEFSQKLETEIRDKYQNEQINIYVVGTAKIIGDFLDGIASIQTYGIYAVVIVFGLLYVYSRCIRSALIPLICSLIAVVWQLGLLSVSGYGLDAYSILVPFLVFSIAISHSVQIINHIAHDIAHGADRLSAARNAFKGLYKAGSVALISDAVGFLTLLVIDIEVIRSLAVASSIGVAVIIITNLALLPIMMSYIGVGKATARYVLKEEEGKFKIEQKVWNSVSSLAIRSKSTITIIVMMSILLGGSIYSRGLKIGDLDHGAPEFRIDSRYNLDNDFVVSNYSTSSDVMIILVETETDQCTTHEVMDTVDDLQKLLRTTDGVQSTSSLVDLSKIVSVGMNEGYWKWYELSRNQSVLNNSVSRNIPEGMYNDDCSMLTINVFLNDHKANTLNNVVNTVNSFNKHSGKDDIKFTLAAGNAGIAVATNQEIEIAQNTMLILVFAVVGLLIFLTFKTLSSIICILIPLFLTSILCQALMTYLDIGVKVATLPVIALGVGIGVDYGIYIFSRFTAELKKQSALSIAYLETLKTTGRAVCFTGITLSAGVITWLYSPIKFQSDMGLLLAFMFLLNMLGAILLIPALANYFVKQGIRQEGI